MKKRRKLFSMAIAIGLVLAMTAGTAENTYAKEDNKKDEAVTGKESFEEKEIPVFKDELTDETITIRFYESTPNIPYVGIKEYYDCIMENSKDDEDKAMTIKKDHDNTYLLKSAHGEAVVDTEKGTMTSENMTEFTNIMCLVREGMDNCYLDGLPYVQVKDTKITGNGYVKFDFAKYNIKIYGGPEDVYFPESTLSNIFTDLVYHYTVCNGETFYFNEVDPGNHENISSIDREYLKPVFDRFDEDFNRPEDLAEYSFNELCFSFDNFYGLPGRAVLNDEIEEKGLEQALADYGEEGQKTLELLKSPNFVEYYNGLLKLQLFVNDAGHTRVDSIVMADARTDELVNAISDLQKKLESEFEVIKAESDEVGSCNRYYYSRKKMRDDVYKGEKYIKQGDTAVYVLDSFMGFDIDKWNEYYTGDGARPTILTMKDDDMLLIDECMKDAVKDPDIRNFVIDCSNNTGGSLDEVAMLYCLITGNREATFHMDNSLTGQKIEETYEADTNFDSVFDEKDEREPYDLNFAILTSENAFSCGNLFPSVMKDDGYLIMGERSGGGGCAVLVQSTGEGMTYRMSAYRGRLVNKDGEGIDNGIPVDIDLIPKRSNGEPKYVTVHGVQIDAEGNTGDRRCPDYSEFYNINRLSEEINRFYKK